MTILKTAEHLLYDILKTAEHLFYDILRTAEHLFYDHPKNSRTPLFMTILKIKQM